jgi:hypothetical protein
MLTTKLLLLLTLSTITLQAEEKTLWKASLTSLAAANALDVRSSWGKHELNPALADSGGNFGREGALIKLGLQGGLFAAEYLITRGHPSKKVYRVLTVVNFGAAGATAAVAARNFTIPR